MALIVKPYTFSPGATIIAAEHNSNFDTSYTLLNGNIDENNIKSTSKIAIMTDWVDYSATSTVVGWSGFTTKSILYRKVGNLVFVAYNLQGTSDAATASFTLPYTASVSTYSWTMTVDNGTNPAAIGYCYMATSTATIYRDGATTAFTSSGTKKAFGQFWFNVT
jgi:hypothetical protein